MRHLAFFVVALSATMVISVSAQDPADIGKAEEVEVRLILIEALVLDEEGKTVPALTADDFQLSLDGVLTPIRSVDMTCSAGVLEEPTETSRRQKRAPVAAEAPRRIVLVLDYHHLARQDRARVIEELEAMLRQGKPTDEEIMVAAIAGGLRIEQRFTRDLDVVVDVLDRMRHDVTLFAPDHKSTTGRSYFEALATLMDVLGAYSDAKAVVLFSGALSRGDLKTVWFEDVVERAAGARAMIYPAYARWFEFTTPRRGTERKKEQAAGHRILPKLAGETGGRVPPSTGDLSLSYARAQRDLACRYSVGFGIASDAAAAGSQIQLLVRKPHITAHYPLRVRVWSEEERRQSRLRAAFADPEEYEHPLVRAYGFPVRPLGANSWDTLLAVQFPMPDDTGGSSVELKATLGENGDAKPFSFERKFPMGEAGSAGRPVTIMGDAKLKPGHYDMTVALSRPGVDDVSAVRVGFEIPSVPRNATFVRGPVLARVLSDGVLTRDLQNAPQGRPLDEVLGDQEGIELLLVHEVDPTDTLLAYWETCSTGKSLAGDSVVARRRILDPQGLVVHDLGSVTVQMRDLGKARCGARLDRIDSGTLQPGEYDLEIVVVDQTDDRELAKTTVPLLVEGS